MSSLYIQIKNKSIPIAKIIEDELDLQMGWRKQIDQMGEQRKYNSRFQMLVQQVKDSCERVKNYYSIIDHNNQTIGVRKGKFNM